MQRFLHCLRFAHQHLADIGDQLAWIRVILVVEFEAAEVKRRGFVSIFFILGRVLRHFCNVLLLNKGSIKQNIAEMS